MATDNWYAFGWGINLFHKRAWVPTWFWTWRKRVRSERNQVGKPYHSTAPSWWIARRLDG